VAFDTSVTGGTATRYALALRQPVYSRERSARGETLAIAARAGDLESLQLRQDLMLRTVDAYFAAALAAERLRLVQRQQLAVDRAATEARDRFQIGDRPVIDVHEANARAAALQADRLAAQAQWQAAREALADLTGLAADASPLPLPGEPPAAGLAPQAEWLARAGRANPGLQLAQARLASAEAQARATASGFAPTLDVVAQLARDRLSGSGDFGSAGNTARNGAIGVQLALPLWTGGMRSAQHAEQVALVERARADAERARLDTQQQARSTWIDLSLGESRTRALAAAVAASRARLDATRVGLQAGDRTTLDLLNAENDAVASELALEEARVGLLVRRLRLAALAGELDDSRLQLANAQLQPPRSD
jgi:outer membrane protein